MLQGNKGELVSVIKCGATIDLVFGTIEFYKEEGLTTEESIEEVERNLGGGNKLEDSLVEMIKSKFGG